MRCFQHSGVHMLRWPSAPPVFGALVVRRIIEYRKKPEIPEILILGYGSPPPPVVGARGRMVVMVSEKAGLATDCL